MHDSGKRQTFNTGAVRDTGENKPHWELVSPYLIRALGFGGLESNAPDGTVNQQAELAAICLARYQITKDPVNLVQAFEELDGTYSDMIRVLERGLKKYQPTDELKQRTDIHSSYREGLRTTWELGIPLSRCMASCYRHLSKLYTKTVDEDDHSGCAKANLMFLLHYHQQIAAGRLPKELDDYPFYEA